MSKRASRRSSSRRFGVIAALVVATAACGGPADPRFGTVTVSSAAPRASLTGSTHAVAPALELSAGCPGYLDPSAPEHWVELADATPVTITARSSGGPTALVVVADGEVRCDSDAGHGHAPHVAIDAPGRYAVHVASLQQAADLPYDLTIAPTGSDAPAIVDRDQSGERVLVSVTITSEPSGATVRSHEGRVLGTTPAMFSIEVAPDELGQERRFDVELTGRRPAQVGGRLESGAMVLHAVLAVDPAFAAAAAPSSNAPMAGESLVVRAENAQPIRDYQVARQTVEIDRDCAIERASVDVVIRHTFIGDLRVVLRSPRGTDVVLHDHAGGGRANLSTSWDWDARRGALRALAGQNARGRWTLSVRDDAGADVGTLRSFALHLACGESSVAAATTLLEQRTAAVVSPPVPVPEATSPDARRPRRPRSRRPVHPPPPIVQPPPPIVPPPPWTGRSNSARGASTP